MTPPNDELQVNRSTHIQTVNYSVVINFHSSNNPYFICTLMYEYVKSKNILFACINTFALSFAHFESDMSNRDRINLLLCNRFMPFRRSTRNWPHNIKCVGCVRVRPRHGLRLNATIAFERIRRHKYMHNATHCTTTTIVFFLGNIPPSRATLHVTCNIARISPADCLLVSKWRKSVRKTHQNN